MNFPCCYTITLIFSPIVYSIWAILEEMRLDELNDKEFVAHSYAMSSPPTLVYFDNGGLVEGSSKKSEKW